MYKMVRYPLVHAYDTMPNIYIFATDQNAVSKKFIYAIW